MSGIIIVVLVVGGYFYYRSQRTDEVVQTETVRTGDVVETVSVTGEYVPLEYADMSFHETGMIDAVLIAEGDTVKAGQKIASLDREVLWSRLKSARIALAIAEQSEKLARRGWDDLHPEEKASEKLAPEQAREAVRLLETQMRDRVLFAPFDGVVSRLDARVGEIATIKQSVVRIIRPGDFVVDARVPESDIAKISMGMRARVTFDALRSDEVFSAEVVNIKPSSTVLQGVVAYIVTFRLLTVDQRLKEGMTVNVDVETAKRENVLILPFRALTKEAGKTYAEVRQDGGSFAKKEVTVGLEGDEGTVEIKSGLEEGDAVTILSTQKK